jgi:hypothetical protein
LELINITDPPPYGDSYTTQPLAPRRIAASK